MRQKFFNRRLVSISFAVGLLFQNNSEISEAIRDSEHRILIPKSHFIKIQYAAKTVQTQEKWLDRFLHRKYFLWGLAPYTRSVF